MKPVAVYQDYLALKRHFTSDYNYQKYNGKLRTNPSTVSYQRDKFFFEKLSKHKDPHRFLLANILVNKKFYIREVAYSPDAERLYSEHVRVAESLTYFFKQDLKKLNDDFLSNLKSACGHPYIVLLYLRKEVLLETLCIISIETKILDSWANSYPYDPIMEDLIMTVKKYTPFIQYDSPKFRKLIADEFKTRAA